MPDRVSITVTILSIFSYSRHLFRVFVLCVRLFLFFFIYFQFFFLYQIVWSFSGVYFVKFIVNIIYIVMLLTFGTVSFYIHYVWFLKRMFNIY